MPKINPDILVWARKTAGLSIDEAAHKLGMSDSSRLGAVERGEQEPSRSLLVKMADKYRRSLLTFYQAKRPLDRDRGQDFRTLTDARDAEAEPMVQALLRDVETRQNLIQAALVEAEEDQPVDFVGSTVIEAGVDDLVKRMHAVLGVSVADFRNQPNVGDAFSLLRTAVERSGVFVLLLGNLGNYLTAIDPKVFRGFALADKIAPFVVINENDSRAAWSFTLLHELAHIWLGQTGVSGYGSDAEVEKFCDTVAARFLLADHELNDLRPFAAGDIPALVNAIGVFASARNLSRKMVAYNLLRVGLIAGDRYRKLTETFDADRAAGKKKKEKGEQGPDYYVVKRHRLGSGLVSVVKRMVDAGALSTPKAGRVLGVRPTAVDRVFPPSRAA